MTARSVLSSVLYLVRDRSCDLFTFLRALDITGRGSIKCEHFKYLVTNIGHKLSVREAEEMLADIDKNKDGYISYREFVQMLYCKEEEEEKPPPPPPIQSDL